jgi:predicted Co/Zn/Cd cation transporter (cation efflux family)
MKTKIADSVILSSTNLLIIGFVYGLPYGGRFVKDPGQLLPLLQLVLAFVVLPTLFLFAFAYTIRDLIKAGMRIQAMLALLLSVPTAIFLRSIKLDL